MVLQLEEGAGRLRAVLHLEERRSRKMEARLQCEAERREQKGRKVKVVLLEEGGREQAGRRRWWC